MFCPFGRKLFCLRALSGANFFYPKLTAAVVPHLPKIFEFILLIDIDRLTSFWSFLQHLSPQHSLNLKALPVLGGKEEEGLWPDLIFREVIVHFNLATADNLVFSFEKDLQHNENVWEC